MKKKKVVPKSGVVSPKIINQLSPGCSLEITPVKTFCVGEDSTIGCNLATDKCTHCRPDYLLKVERKTTSEIVVLLADHYPDFMDELTEITEKQEALYSDLDLGILGKQQLANLSQQLHNLAFKMTLMGSALYLNLLFNNMAESTEAETS